MSAHDTTELRALEALRFNWTRSQDEVWSSAQYHVEGLHPDVSELLRRGIDEASSGVGAKPLGVAIQGERGVGKTHLLGWARERVQRVGGYFFLVSVHSKATFWHETLGSIRNGLMKNAGSGRTQLEDLLADLTHRAGADASTAEAILGGRPPTRTDIDGFVNALRLMDRTVGLMCQDTARALVLLASPKPDHQDVGHYYLSGDGLQDDERRQWGIRSRRKEHPLLIEELSQLLALSGPTVLAVDQIDAIIEERSTAAEPDGPEAGQLLTGIAGGLMAMRDLTRRTLTVVACLPESWQLIRTDTVDTVADRFRNARQLRNLPTADVGRAVVEKRLAIGYANIGFEPPYPSWPIAPAAFDEVRRYTVRLLLKRVEAHVDACLRAGTVRELDRLGDWSDTPTTTPPSSIADGSGSVTDVPVEADVDPEALAALDERFEALCAEADPSAALDPKTEDAVVPALLSAGLEAWIREHETDGESERPFTHDASPGKQPELHARLRLVVDERTERERQWTFRAIATGNARAAQSRLRKAMEMTGLSGRDGRSSGDGRTGERRLFVLRNDAWPSGRVSVELRDAFLEMGGTILLLTTADLTTFSALGHMLTERDPALRSWLRARRPATGTALLTRALDGATAVTMTAGGSSGPPAEPAHQADPADPMHPIDGADGADRAGAAAAPTIRIGTTTAEHDPVRLDLASLRRHTLLVAGSGSGKTVLLRRLVEECALQGVSAIVLDLNNDLAQLGDPWPSPPEHWLDGDAERAERYLADTDVVVWTPGRSTGRPLSFQPLPSFADVVSEPDAFETAIMVAIDALAPQLDVDKATSRANRERAVLKEALRYFARNGGGELTDFKAMLAALPMDAGSLPGAAVTATALADRLAAAIINDPLFGGAGRAADPGMLLTPPPGKRARISVISLIGLSSDGQVLGFINRLQLAMFSWITKHPAVDRPLGGLFVMDEAQNIAPSGRSTACTQSTVRLASQARKYGLGLVFATQAPRGLNNQIPGNATTQLFGKLSAPAQIDAAERMSRAGGGGVPDIGRLTAGQFYLATEGRGFRSIRTPMCLSHHPNSPLTEDEVLARSRRSAP